MSNIITQQNKRVSRVRQAINNLRVTDLDGEHYAINQKDLQRIVLNGAFATVAPIPKTFNSSSFGRVLYLLRTLHDLKVRDFDTLDSMNATLALRRELLAAYAAEPMAVFSTVDKTAITDNANILSALTAIESMSFVDVPAGPGTMLIDLHRELSTFTTASRTVSPKFLAYRPCLGLLRAALGNMSVRVVNRSFKFQVYVGEVYFNEALDRNTTTPPTLPDPYELAKQTPPSGVIPADVRLQWANYCKNTPEIHEPAISQRRINAIKALRERSNLGLMEAKNVIEAVYPS